jgi:hypothetical protein
MREQGVSEYAVKSIPKINQPVFSNGLRILFQTNTISF